MQVTKNIGYIYDEGEYVTLPIAAPAIGKYKIRVKTPNSSKEVQRIYEVTEIGENLKLPNYNGRKTLELGTNLFYIYEPSGQRLVIDEANKFELFFALPETEIGPVISSADWVHLEYPSGIIDNENKRFTVNNQMIEGTEYVYIDFLLMIKNVDYTINYTQKEILFNEAVEIGETIRISYQKQNE